VLAYLKRFIHNAKSHQGFRRHFANISWIFFERILRLVAGLFVGIWVARYLGPTQFGMFSYAVAFSALFSNFAKLGLDDIVVRDLAGEPIKRDIYLGTAFWLKLIGSITMICLLWITLEFTASDSATKLYVFIIASGAIFQAYEVVDFYFQSQVLSKFVSICKIAQLLISSLLKLYFMFTNADLFWFVLVSLIDQATLAVSLYFAYRHQKIGAFYWCFDWTIAKKMLKNSWPLIISGFVIMIYMRIDQVMIKEMLGVKEVGIYSAAVRVAEIWYFIPGVITSSFLPSIMNAKKIGEDYYYQRLQKLYTLMIWLAISIALVITFLSDWIILTLYGVAYIDASEVLMINIWTGVFIFFGSAWSKWMLIENRMKMSSFFQVNAMIFNVVLNLILIPKYGIYGAAISTLIAASIGHTVLPLFIKSQRIALKMFLISFFPIYLLRVKNEKLTKK
jgi:O-antigen/teichoic acid export membrane protein